MKRIQFFGLILAALLLLTGAALSALSMGACAYAAGTDWTTVRFQITYEGGLSESNVTVFTSYTNTFNDPCTNIVNNEYYDGIITGLNTEVTVSVTSTEDITTSFRATVHLTGYGVPVSQNGNSGWFDTGGRDAIDFYITVTPLRTYTVQFDKNHESAAGEMSPQTFRMNEYQALTANSFTREGHTFIEWNTRPDGTGFSYGDRKSVKNLTETPDETVTLYAQWARNCAVRFDANGGAGDMTDQTFTVGIRQNLKPNTFSREGYAFTGWNTRADGAGDAFANAQRLTNELEPYGDAVTLYAQWAANYTVRFDNNGGAGEMSDQVFAVGIPQGLTPNAFSRQGYRFTGWTTQPDGTGDSFDDGQSVVSLTESPGTVVTLYARWIAPITARAIDDGRSFPIPDCLPISRGFMPTTLAGNYYVSESVSYDRPIRFSGTTILILGKDCVMNVGTQSDPIAYGEAAILGVGYSQLLIYRESAASGQLNVHAAGRPAISIPEGFLTNGGGVFASAAGDGVRTVDLGGFTQVTGSFSVSASGDHAAALYTANNLEVNGGEISATAEGTGAAAISGLIDVTVNGGTVAASADGDASVALSAAHFVDFNGGLLSAVADGADAIGLRGLAINLGWTGSGNRVTASSYSGAVTVDDGQFFRGSSGGYYSGRIEDNAALANERLTPANIIVNCGQGGSVAADRYFAAEDETVALTAAPDEGYELESLAIKQGETDVALDENNCFTMPAGTVTVTATFAEKRYQIYAEEDARWEIQITDAAREGARVGFMAEISFDYWGAYELTDVTVTDANGDEVAVKDDEFIMPAGDVWVRPVFAPMILVTFEIDELFEVMMVQTDSHSWSPEDAHALEGETVRFESLSCDDRFERCAVNVTAEDGTPVACERYSEYYEEYDFTDTGWRFIMPGTPVTVRVTPAFGEADFTLPAFLTTVEEEAFEGIAASVVDIPESCVSIGAHAFRNCPNLTQIRIPDGCALGTDVFDSCEMVYVYGTAGSSADSYCQSHDNCMFVAIE